MFSEKDYEEQLKLLIELLQKAGEEHWVRYFNEALYKYNSGKINSSYKHVLRAYGGMGSFNDIVLNAITDEEVATVENIRTALWSYCKTNKRLF